MCLAAVRLRIRRVTCKRSYVGRLATPCEERRGRGDEEEQHRSTRGVNISACDPGHLWSVC